MAQELYCWRCRIEMPMLDEGEWKQMAPLISSHDEVERERALDLYADLTGVLETNPNAIWHHRRSLYGPKCEDCGRPLRTPRAKFCADCPPR